MSDLHVVLGATGGLGAAVVAELTARGHQVRAVSRNGDFAADVTTTEGAVKACAGASVVYQCAQPPYAKWAAEFPAFIRPILHGIEAAGAKLVMADNLYVYGPVDGPMTEGLPHAATDPKGRARIDVDAQILAAHREGRIRATLGRASDYYGPGGVNTTIGPTIFAAALAGKTARWVGDLDMPHTVAYAPDVAAGLVTLGERDEADGRAWHLPAAEPVTGREFLTKVWAALGEKPKIAGLGHGMQRVLALVNPMVRALGDTWYQRDRPFVADDSAFREAFGPVRVTPHDAGIAATLEWFRKIR